MYNVWINCYECSMFNLFISNIFWQRNLLVQATGVNLEQAS